MIEGLKTTGPINQLEVSGIRATFGSKNDVISIFDELSFILDQGDILAIFGPNGCGKTTMLRVLAGLKEINKGKIRYNNQLLKREILSFIPQDFRASFFNWCSLEMNIALTQDKPFKNRVLHAKKLEELKEEFGIDLDLSLRPHQCSGGMLQQAALLRALVSSPKLLLADEPFSALDINVSGKIRQRFVERVKRDKTIVIAVMHSIEDIIEVSDKVLAIPNMPYSGVDLPGFAMAEMLNNSNSNKNRAHEQNSFVSMARNIISPGNINE